MSTERGTLGQLPYTALQVRETIFDGREGTFGTWKHRLLRRLAKLRLDHCLIRTPLEEACAVDLLDTKVDEAKKEVYRKRLNDDTDALDEIVMAINNDVLNYILGATCAKEAMGILIREFLKEGTGCLISMRGRLQTLRERKFDSLSELFYNYDVIVRELDRLGAKMSSAEKIHSLLLAIPGRFNHVRGALTVLPNEELCKKPIAEIKRMFLDAEIAMGEERKNGREKRSGPPNVALKTSSKKAEPKCFGCGEIGHYKNRCPRRPRKQRNGHGGGRAAGGHAMIARARRTIRQVKLVKLARAVITRHWENAEPARGREREQPSDRAVPTRGREREQPSNRAVPTRGREREQPSDRAVPTRGREREQPSDHAVPTRGRECEQPCDHAVPISRCAAVKIPPTTPQKDLRERVRVLTVKKLPRERELPHKAASPRERHRERTTTHGSSVTTAKSREQTLAMGEVAREQPRGRTNLHQLQAVKT
ncbi:predicted protein [Culex quinquefasciatus]|uniref:Predicted protein n=1 Tax=Culex quinquefasciatus TaxID=7176 RepID=B0X5K5_CULQU|nr:predicted protein [Culex quinquefasciatus]|eukprot:XP_001864927.1 predicted protein [Culex quinquefasciatus]